MTMPIIFAVLGLYAFGLTSAVTPASASTTCEIYDDASLRTCFSHASTYDNFVFIEDIVCGSNEGCCPNRHAAILLQGLVGKQVKGNGHSLRRQAGQYGCPVIVIKQASRIVVENLVLDEDIKEPACELSERSCPSTIEIGNSNDVKLDGIRVYAGKGYVVKVTATNGFTFTNSTISDAGIIGLYVGHYQYGPSKTISITNSVFAGSRTNGIALQGVYSSDPDNPSIIADNVLVDNHWHGLWPIPGGVTTGGQLLIDDGENIRVTRNIIAGGICENCFRSHHVNAIEIGDVAPAPAGAHGLVIDDNLLINSDEIMTAIRQNPGALVSNVTINANRIIRYGEFLTAKTGLRRSPQPGANASPVFLCTKKITPSQHFSSATKDCDGDGDIAGVLGFVAPNR